MFRRLFCLGYLLVSLQPAVLRAADQQAILELKINEIKKGEVSVLLRDTDVLVRLKDLQAAGLKALPESYETIRGEPFVLVSSLAPQVTFNVDEKDLTLNLIAQASILGFNRLDVQPNRPSGIGYSEDASGFVNYLLSLRDFQHTTAFSEAGITLRNSLLYGAVSRNEDGSFVRGLSNLTISNRENLNRTVLGDRLITSDVLGGSLVMGGISFFREFSLDPYFVRNPGLNYSGAVATPSTIDVYVNGQLLRRVPLPPGEFELKDLPVPAGVGDTRLVLRDAFGREQEIGSQHYFTSGLLKDGLHEFSYNFGSRRNELATESWGYGPPVLLARHRLGITDSLTGALRLEASSGVVSGGPSFSFRLPVGEMELAAAASAGEGMPGGAGFVGFSYLGRTVNFGASARVMTAHYATTNLAPFDKRSWLQINTLLGFPIMSGVGVTLRYVHENSRVDRQSHRFSLATSTRLTDRLSLFLTGGVSKQRTGTNSEIFTGLGFLFGETTGTVSYQKFDGADTGLLTLQKSLPVGAGFGYRLQAGSSSGGKNPSVDNLLQYQGPYGRYEANYTRVNGQNSTLLNTAGGIAIIGGDVFLTRPIQDSFALIQTGVGGVRGFSNNQEVGLSNSGGNLFVPNLLPYYGNKLGISDKDIPLNYKVDATERTIGPPFRGGAVVSFPVQRIQRILGQITLDDGVSATVPAYGELSLIANGKLFESPIGRQGEFYLENLPAGRYSAKIEHKEGSCTFALEVPELDQSEIKLGTLKCQVSPVSH
jgi:outer membrane usher protein